MTAAVADERPGPKGTQAGAPTPLALRLARRIAQDGPMTVAEFMLACLHDPQDGYYATRPALGEGGDFITAPLVSQMFGELVGAWLAALWLQMGRPAPVRLVELGPGDGTLMSDALRALGAAPGLREAADLWLVEPSRPLRDLQAERLACAAPRFAGALAEVPAGAPLLLVANEVFDCLPAHQFVRTADGWAERRVGLDDAGGLVFGLAPLPSGVYGDLPEGAPTGAVVERSSAQTALAAEIGQRIAVDGGAALVLDYGAVEPGVGDTLQALASHRRVDPLAATGEADLTMHVDFASVAAAARDSGARTSAAIPQGVFLCALGIEARAERLARARPDLEDVIARQVARLTATDEMGTLFKVLAIHSPGLKPPGFPERTP